MTIINLVDTINQRLVITGMTSKSQYQYHRRIDLSVNKIEATNSSHLFCLVEISLSGSSNFKKQEQPLPSAGVLRFDIARSQDPNRRQTHHQYISEELSAS